MNNIPIVRLLLAFMIGLEFWNNGYTPLCKEVGISLIVVCVINHVAGLHYNKTMKKWMQL